MISPYSLPVYSVDNIEWQEYQQGKNGDENLCAKPVPQAIEHGLTRALEAGGCGHYAIVFFVLMVERQHSLQQRGLETTQVGTFTRVGDDII